MLIWKFWGTGSPAPGLSPATPAHKRKAAPSAARSGFSFPLIGGMLFTPVIA